MNVPGLTGTSFQRQQQLYQKMGAPMGKYAGNASQNTYLLGQLGKQNYGIPKVAVPTMKAAKPKVPTLAQRYVQSVVPKPVITPTSFGQVVNRDQFINRPLVEQFAYSQVDPEINRIREQQTRGLNEQQASSGMYRFGMAGRQQNELADQISRQRQEMAQPFMQQGLNTLGDYYNDLETEYYKDPQAFQYNPMQQTKLLTNLYGTV